MFFGLWCDPSCNPSCDLWCDLLCHLWFVPWSCLWSDPVQSNSQCQKPQCTISPSFLEEQEQSKECFEHFKNISYCICINLPTLISNLDRRVWSSILTRYTSVTNSSCPRSTLDHGKLECAPNVHDPSTKFILLFPSTALSLVPPLTVYECWYVGFWNARFSGRKCPHKKKKCFPGQRWSLSTYWSLNDSCIELYGFVLNMFVTLYIIGKN